MSDAGIRMVKNDPNNAKIYLVGHKGWIGSMYLEELEKKNINCEHSDLRAETEEIKIDIIEKNITHVVCCMGRTHGTFQEKKYTTIDYLENKETLPINLNDNLYAPLSLALFCDKNDIHFTYIGTGCIYEYDKEHEIESGNGFKENDKPNFFGSNYSIVKGFTNNLMKQTNALHLRIRMPITGSQNPRNFITKITTYEKICSIQNSMSVLDELIPLSVRMMINKETGTFNFTNPGSISHNEILEMYRDIVDPYFTWKKFTIEEQDEILLGKRSNNLLDTTLLENRYQITNIKESVKNCLTIMKENNMKLKENNKSTVQLLEDFLLEQCKKIKESGETIQNSDKNDKVAVIIEPRNHKLLEPVVRNVMHNLGKEWNLHIFGHDLAYIKSSFPKSNFTFTGLTSNNLTTEEYNKLLRNLDFWNAIKQEHILIFQTDSFIMNKLPNLDKYLEYPFIGGVYHLWTTKLLLDENKPTANNQHIGWDNNINKQNIHITDPPKTTFSINGGFTLRKKSAMINCLNKITDDLIKTYRKQFKMDTRFYTGFISEDVYFHHSLELLGYNLPGLKECNEFCNNLHYPEFNPKSFGIHNINKSFCVDKFSIPILEYICQNKTLTAHKSTTQLLEDFLLEQSKKIKESGETIQNSDKNDKVAVIVEPRNHKLLEPVIRNVMHHLGKEWNLHIFGHDLAYIRSSFPKSNITFTGLTDDILTSEEHNKLLKNLDFWNAIKQEHILIFQTDSFIMNKISDLDKYLDYPFIGGVYKSYIFENRQVNGWDERGAIQLTDTPKQDFSINGNFSLRKKSAMVDCLHKINDDLIKINKKHNSKFPEIMEEFMKNDQAEDFYFHHALEFLNYNLPSLEECNKFCNNLYYPTFNKEAFAIRNIDKEFVFHDNRFRSEIEEILKR